MEKRCKFIEIDGKYYVTSDDEIKEGDWACNGEYVFRVESFYKKKDVIGGIIYTGSYENELAISTDDCRKVIATTDSSLTKCKGCANNYKYDPLFDGYETGKYRYHRNPKTGKNFHCDKGHDFPQISEDFIQAYVKANGEIDEVMVDYVNYIHSDQSEFLIPTLHKNAVVISQIEQKTFTKEELLLLKDDLLHICKWYQGRDTVRCEKVEKWIEENL